MKGERENFEISGFLEAYARLPQGRKLVIIRKGEKPDYVVCDTITKKELGVELTSVYVDDRSVPDVHKRNHEGLVEIPYDRNALERYSRQLIAAVINKVCKARKGYTTDKPLILAIYVNEYIGIYIGIPELEQLVSRYEAVFDSIAPFSEIVFWNLANGAVFQAKAA